MWREGGLGTGRGYPRRAFSLSNLLPVTAGSSRALDVNKASASATPDAPIPRPGRVPSLREGRDRESGSGMPWSFDKRAGE